MVTNTEGSATDGLYARWLTAPENNSSRKLKLKSVASASTVNTVTSYHLEPTHPHFRTEMGYNEMIGNTTQLTYITDPSFADVDGPCEANAPKQVCTPATRSRKPPYTFHRSGSCNPGLALPLIALQYHEVKINIDLRPIDECLWAVNDLGNTGSTGSKATTAYNQSLVAASLYVDYIFLDTDERRRMAQNPHEYLIEQQFTGDESVGSSSNKIKLNFNHPCKELVWVVQPDANVDYCASLEGSQDLYKLFGAQPFNYTMLLTRSRTPSTRSRRPKGGNDAVIDSRPSSMTPPLKPMRVALLPPRFPTSPPARPKTRASRMPARSSSRKPPSTCTAGAKTQSSPRNSNSTARTASRNAKDRTSTLFSRSSTTPATRTRASTSTRLRPEEHQPSGTCNFSRIDNATLQLVLSNATVSGTNTAKVRVYATNYNVLRIMSGMGGLAYSN